MISAPSRKEEFQAVAVIGVMARGQLHRAVAAKIHRGHEHGGGGGQTAVEDRHAPGGQRSHNRVPQPGAGQPAVPAQGNGQRGGGLAGFTGQPAGEGGGQLFHHLVGQIEGLVLHTVQRHAANVGAAFKMLPIGSKHVQIPSFL